MEASARRTENDIAVDAGRRWWQFLVSGAVWALFALTVFRFDITSVTTIGAVIGVFCIVAGVMQFFALGISSTGWKIVRVILGVLFILVGVAALAYPHRTFVEVAAIFAFFLLFKGVFDIMVSLMGRRLSDLWWVTMLVGVAEILLAFWAAGNFGREAVLLVVWVGAAALAHAVTDFVLAARLYDLQRARPARAA